MKGRLLPWLTVLSVLALTACGTTPKKAPAAAPGSAGKHVAGGRAAQSRPLPADCPEGSPYARAQEDPSTRGNYTAGGLYKPGVRDTTPDYVPNVACIPEPLVTDEPRSPVGNRSPYTVLGKQYRVLDRAHGYAEQGTASYYGAKFHGRLTSNQEVYDMYAFTAAHKTLPLPSFARVTNLDNGESVVVRVNDRGPFHEGRVVDLSYAAAVRLGIVARGTGRVEVRALVPGENAAPVARAPARGSTAPAPARPQQASTAPATPATAMDQLVQALPTPLPAPASAPFQAALATGPVLQVASFSSQDNARRALDRLLAAGIAGARLDDVVAGGRTLWRLRVAPGPADAAELAGRIAGLGFGTPQLIRE